MRSRLSLTGKECFSCWSPNLSWIQYSALELQNTPSYNVLGKAKPKKIHIPFYVVRNANSSHWSKLKLVMKTKCPHDRTLILAWEQYCFMNTAQTDANIKIARITALLQRSELIGQMSLPWQKSTLFKNYFDVNIFLSTNEFVFFLKIFQAVLSLVLMFGMLPYQNVPFLAGIPFSLWNIKTLNSSMERFMVS